MASDERTLEDLEGPTPDRRPGDAAGATVSSKTTGGMTAFGGPSPVAGEATSDGVASDDPNLGRRIGPYRVERLIARGGMGAVYLAARQDDYQHRVALKLVHPELQTAGVLRRFAAERQILANLQHPHIARILDGGTTDDALPFFVMDYVEGVAVDRYCDEHELSLRRRLELFRQVCAAVHFAHQNLVVHRDLKPGNILVTEGGEPRLLDFGIARILDDEPGREERRGAGPERSDRGVAPLTPDYASPEQFRGTAITTASDVYSLGVLLYRLTSGRPPYRLREADPARWAELVCERQPTRPSQVARADGAGRRVQRRLEGDVDAIVAKAMRKQPRERYASALQLAQDVERHLADLPVEAHPATWAYRAGKFARRQKLGLAAALLVVAFAVAVTVLWRQAVAERAIAERARTRAETVSQFLEDLFESADPDEGRGDTLTVREALDQGREKLAGELAAEPEIRADLLATLGTVYHNLGHYDDARQLKEEALRIRLAAGTADRQALAVDLNNLGRLHYDRGDFDVAEARYTQALGIWQRLEDGAGTALAWRNLAAVASQRGDASRALELYGWALRLDQQLYGDDDPRVAASLYGLGARHRRLGDPARAEPLLRQALAIYSRSFGADHTKVASVAGSLGLAIHAQGDLAEAREYLEQALATRRRLLGDGHLLVARSEKNLAALLLDQGEVAAAGELLERTLATLRRQRPAGDWMIADAESVWGGYLVAVGRTAEAEPLLRASMETLAAVKGEEDLHTLAARRRLAALYQARGEQK